MEIADKKELKRLYDIEYRAKNKEKIQARNKAYRAKNLDKIKKYLESTKEIRSIQRKEYYQRTIDAQLKRYKKYREENKDKILERSKKRYQEKKEEIRAYGRLQYRKHKAKRLARGREWAKENREKVSGYWGKRRADKRNRTPKWLSKDDLWMLENAYELAHIRSNMFGFKWHVDHIIPLRGTTISGLHVPNNIQVVPADWNLRKSNVFIEKFFG